MTWQRYITVRRVLDGQSTLRHFSREEVESRVQFHLTKIAALQRQSQGSENILTNDEQGSPTEPRSQA